MSVLRPPLQDRLYCRSLNHSLSPCFDSRPIFDIYAKEHEHPGHSEREVGYVSDGGTVWEGDVVLSGKKEALFQYVPLFQDVGVESV